MKSIHNERPTRIGQAVSLDRDKDVPAPNSSGSPRPPRSGRLRLVAHRPGPGFEEERRRDRPFAVLLPDETAMLFREALAYAQHAFQPKLHEAPELLLPRLLASAATGGFRDAGFDVRQEEEWAYLAETLGPRSASDPWTVDKSWRDRHAVPRLHLLQDLCALDPYEYGLVYLLMHTLDRPLSRSRMLGEIRALIRSWNTTMEPGQGLLSLTMLRLALRGYAWWTRLPDGIQSVHAAMVASVIGSLEGACTAISGQHLLARRSIDWNRVHLAMLAGALSHSLPALPKLQAWQARWNTIQSGQKHPDARQPDQGLPQHTLRPERSGRKAPLPRRRHVAFAERPAVLKAVAEPAMSLERKGERMPDEP